MAYMRHFVSFLSVLYIVHGSKISISEDGGYNDIVFKIHKEISETDCPAILKGIKVNIFL